MQKQGKKSVPLIVALFICSLMFVLVACAPKQATGEEGEAEQVAVNVPLWSQNSDCTSCHVAEVQSGVSGSASIYALHTEEACITCHTDDGGVLADAHEEYATAEQPTKLEGTEVADATCVTCHDIEEIKIATAGSTVLTDVNGTVVNPHDVPQTQEHGENIECATCHKMHTPDPIADVARQACVSCHHQGVYDCKSCHG
jgi:hypothetical protein